MNWNYVTVENKINIDGKGHLQTSRNKKIAQRVGSSSTNTRISFPEL